jgi:hypothetical protein
VIDYPTFCRLRELADQKHLNTAQIATRVGPGSQDKEVRQGKVIKETDDVRFAVTSYWPEEAGPQPLLELASPNSPWCTRAAL